MCSGRVRETHPELPGKCLSWWLHPRWTQGLTRVPDEQQKKTRDWSVQGHRPHERRKQNSTQRDKMWSRFEIIKDVLHLFWYLLHTRLVSSAQLPYFFSTKTHWHICSRLRKVHTYSVVFTDTHTHTHCKHTYLISIPAAAYEGLSVPQDAHSQSRVLGIDSHSWFSTKVHPVTQITAHSNHSSEM